MSIPVPAAPGPSASGSADARDRVVGLYQAVLAWVLWGIIPAYFVLLAPTESLEIVAMRVLMSLVVCGIIIAIARTWRPLFDILRRPRLVLLMGLAGLFILINWTTYVIATLTGHVVEASLGYFINPIVTVLLGVFILRERLRVAQWAAVAIAAIAVVALAVAYGVFPWISLILAFSFGLYGFVKKWVGPRVDAVSGLTIETLWLAPVAVGMLVFVGATTGITFGTVSLGHTVLLASAGVVTAVPLLLFASASRRIPLVWIGLSQFLTPLLQFSFGVFVMGEPMPLERWLGFGLVWVALVVLMVDMVLHARSTRRASPLPA